MPATRRNGLELSGLTLTSVPSVLMITKGKPWLDQALPTPPTAARTFVAGDQIVAAVEVIRQGSPRPAQRSSRESTGATAPRQDSKNAASSRPVDRAASRSVSPSVTAKLPAGRYVLRVTLEAPGAEPLERAVPFDVVGR